MARSYVRMLKLPALCRGTLIYRIVIIDYNDKYKLYGISRKVSVMGRYKEVSKRVIECKSSGGFELNLSELDLSSIPDEVWDLRWLQSLNLLYNRISSIPEEIGRLKRLKLLGMSFNRISSIPECIMKAKNLETLYMSNNRLSSIPAMISELKELKKLNLSGNMIESIPGEMGELNSLQDLNLSGNSITSIPEGIAGLGSLKKLNLSNNRLSSIPEEIGELKNLYELNLNGNNIIYTPEQMGRLKKLYRLDLSNNRLKSVPEEVTALINLTKLDLSKNLIESVPEEIGKLTNLKELYLADNQIATIPPEIIKEGVEAIVNYLKQTREQGTLPNNEAKILLVGEPGAGKTTLAKKLFNPNIEIPDNSQPSTLGIEVLKDKEFKYKGDKIKAHIWDFGGQDIQYFLHQFFLTPDSLYIFLSDYRSENTRYDYWFDLIKLLSRSSPVVVVENEKNISSRSGSSFALNKYTKKYPALEIRHVEIDLKNRGAQWESLVEIISEQLSTLRPVGMPIPRLWLKIRERLESIKADNYISLDRFYEICREEGLMERENQDFLKEFLHNLGIILHFDTEDLGDRLFLNPNWIVKALYAILKNDGEHRFDSIVERDELYGYWESLGYLREECAILLKLLLKNSFDLCYRIPSERGAKSSRYLFPLLLSRELPNFKWESRENINFRYEYPFMPEGIISRLIVKLHNRVAKGDNGNELVWKDGMILSYKDSLARVKQEIDSDVGKKVIEIAVCEGTLNDRKEFLSIIRGELESLNEHFKGLNCTRKIPCNCIKCKKAERPYYFDFEDIEGYIADNSRTIECRVLRKGVSITSLCGAIFKDEENPSKQEEQGIFNLNLSMSDNRSYSTTKYEGDQNIMEVINPKECQIIENVNNSEINFKKKVVIDEGLSKEETEELIRQTIEAMRELPEEELQEIKLGYESTTALEKVSPELAEKNKEVLKKNLLNSIAGEVIPVLQNLTASAIFELMKAAMGSF